MDIPNLSTFKDIFQDTVNFFISLFKTMFSDSHVEWLQTVCDYPMYGWVPLLHEYDLCHLLFLRHFNDYLQTNNQTSVQKSLLQLCSPFVRRWYRYPAHLFKRCLFPILLIILSNNPHLCSSWNSGPISPLGVSRCFLCRSHLRYKSGYGSNSPECCVQHLQGGKIGSYFGVSHPKSYFRRKLSWMGS